MKSSAGVATRPRLQGLPANATGKRHCIQRLDELWDFLDQSNISAKNIQRLRTLVAHPDAEVQGMATLVLDVALVHPHKRRRWRHLAARHREMFDRAVTLLGPEFFYEVLSITVTQRAVVGRPRGVPCHSPGSCSAVMSAHRLRRRR